MIARATLKGTRWMLFVGFFALTPTAVFAQQESASQRQNPQDQNRSETIPAKTEAPQGQTPPAQTGTETPQGQTQPAQAGTEAPQGQTEAAHALCTGIPKARQKHLEVKGAGHYGIFSGRRWREIVYPQIREFIAKNNTGPRTAVAAPAKKKARRAATAAA